MKIISHIQRKDFNKIEDLFIRNNIYKRSFLTNEKPKDKIISKLKITLSLIVKEFTEVNILNNKITEYKKYNKTEQKQIF